MIVLTEFLLDMTIGSCVTAGAIILLRLLFGRFLSARSKYLLWMLLALRLCLPVLPYSPWSIYHIPAQAELAMEQQAYMTDDQVETTVYTTPTPIPTGEIQPVEQEITLAPAIIETKVTFWEILNQANVIVYFVYHIGLIACFAGYGVLLYRTRKRLYQAEPVEDEETLAAFRSVRGELGITKSIPLRYGSEPMIGGARNPVLLIPRELCGEELRTTLVHELMHYKSGDLRIAAFQRILCCIYWFNPVAWLCFRQARKDCELACDQQVLQYGYAEQKGYAELLLHEGEMKRKLHVGTTAFGAPDLKKRIKAIGNLKKPRVWMTMLAVLAALLIGVLALTGDTVRLKYGGMVTPDVEMNQDLEIHFTEPGQTYCIDYTVKPSNAEVSFISNNYDVAYSNGVGVVTAAGPGMCEIRVVVGYRYGDELLQEREVGTIVVTCDFPTTTDLSPAGFPLTSWMDFTSEELTNAYLGKSEKSPTQVIREEFGEYLSEDFINSFDTHPISEFLQFGSVYGFHPSSTYSAIREKEYNDGVEFNDYDITLSMVYENSTMEDQALTLTGIVHCNSENKVESITLDELPIREFYDRFDTTVKETNTFDGQRTAYHFNEELEVLRAVEVEMDGVYYDRDEGTDTFYADFILQDWPEEGNSSGGQLEFPEFREVRNGFTSGSIFYHGPKGYESLGQLFISFADGGYLPEFLIALEDGTYIGCPGGTEEERRNLMDQLFGAS